ncbi:MAG: hypothetical protein IPF54_17105 [Draconibacterium sp.]|nr:hypothetical protein [Draconibacterium sp.]
MAFTWIHFACKQEKLHYKNVDNYMFVQNEERRNDSTEWQLVWEDNFSMGFLDTTHWTGLVFLLRPNGNYL